MKRPHALGLQLTLFRLPWRRPSNVVRAGCLLVAAGLFSFYAVALAPSLNHTLRDHWAAAERGDTAVARDLRDRFRNDHRKAELILQVNLLLVLGGLAASAVALGPDPKPTGGLPAPALLQQR